MKQKTLNKLIAMLILFALMFSNFGYPIASIATSDGFQVITNGFFQKDEIEFSAYFEKDEKKTDENISDVNNKAQLKMTVSPMVEGYLKNANIKAVSGSDESINFKITGIHAITSDETEESVDLETDEELNKEENIVSSETVEDSAEVNEVPEQNIETGTNESNTTQTENTVSSEANTQDELPIQSSTTNTTNEVENSNVANTTSELPIQSATRETNTVESSNKTVNLNTVSGTNTVENTTTNIIQNETEENVPQAPASDPSEDILINEEEVIEEKVAEAEAEEKEELDLISDIQIIADNEINIVNILQETTIILDIEYVQNENLNINDLYKEIKLQLTGTYINVDLEEIAVAKEDTVYVGWNYSKDIEISSEYTKVSPFKIGDKQGTIVENKVTVKRETTDEKYLPLKSTSLEITIPTFNNKMPIEVDVYATKLMATKGEDAGSITFSNNNWVYDKENRKVTIQVANEENGIAKNTLGEDEYVIIYRFEDYTEGMTSKLERNIKVDSEQYSALENITFTKTIRDGQEVSVNVGELITYSINTNEEKIPKGKIYANYNSAEPIYETEYTSNVTVNILTSDMLETLKINCLEEVYKDINGFEFKADGIQYKTIKFNYNEIKNIIENGGSIEIHNNAGELLYTLNSSLIKGEEDCTVNLNYANGIVVHVNNISVNGNINFELTKVIKKCNYDKAAFKNFKQLESRISAEVKYANLEETISLEKIGTTKDFEESYSKANLYMNKEILTTIQDNENVELKIELNNDKENSDLYINPSFELVFPRYVTEVNVESINLLYENGLRVKDFQTYTESDIVKMRIELEGTQTTFCESTATNGTNIIVNVKIKVDDYTPSKEDQIKLYYCNEGVTNYESQTKWTISKQVPNGILKTTNGFDVAVFKYQAPNGLVAINGIVNYDGNLSEIKSVKQGATTRQIPLNTPSRISTMELLALNNTSNECSDVVLLGRIPFKGNKNVITNEDLKTTTNALMKDFIKEDIENSNMVEIYYSEKENTNKSLSDGANGWRTKENISDISKIRSFLIVVKGNLKTGTVLRFTYDFEIPENLPYDTSIAGSFGAYYNNNTDVAVVYESSAADLVGLTTEVGPKIEVKLNVDIGDGAKVLGGRRLKYTATVVNSGSFPAANIVVNAPIPNYTIYTKKGFLPVIGDYGFENDGSKKELTFNVETLNPGETKEFTYYVEAGQKPTLENYSTGKDESGYYKVIDGEKTYITEVPPIYITNKVTVTSALLANVIESNEVKNELEYVNFDIDTKLDYDRSLNPGMETNFTFSIKNISGKSLENVEAIFNVNDIYEYNTGKVQLQGTDIGSNITYDSNEGKIYFPMASMEPYDIVTITTNVIAKNINVSDIKQNCYLEVKATNMEKSENGTNIPQEIAVGWIESEDTSVNIPSKIKEGDEVVITTRIDNVSKRDVTAAVYECEIPNCLDVVSITTTGSKGLSSNIADGKISGKLPIIPTGESISIDMIVKAKNMAGTDTVKAILNRVIKNENQEDIAISSVEFNIENTEKTEEEIFEEEKEKFEQAEEEYNKKEETNSTEDNVTQNNNNASNNNNNNTQQNDPSVNQNVPTTNNNTNNNSNQGENNTQTDNNQPATEEHLTYTVTGRVWDDENKNGVREDSEKGLSSIQVYLLTSNNKMIKTTTTNSEGIYSFNDVENGKYIVAFAYDTGVYVITTYKKSGAEEDRNSDAIESKDEDLNAVTNTITVENNNVTSIDLGLQNKEIFDLGISKYISKVIVTTNKETKTYDYENLDLAKLEIRSRDIEGAKVDLEYTVILENKGSLAGSAEQVVDYLPSDVEFDENKNQDWYKGNDGYIYIKNLNQTTLKPGEKKEYKLNVTKTMTEENTGVLSNKVEIIKAFTNSNESENVEHNSSTQNMMITISTGGTVQAVIVFIFLIAIFTGIVYRNKIPININLTKVYKAEKTEEKKSKTKKFYK